MSDPSCPIGKKEAFEGFSPEQYRDRLTHLAALPANLRAAVSSLTNPRLDTPYRDGGWTVRQIVHHLADTHMQGFLVCKFALTVENPTWPPFSHEGFSASADVKVAPLGPSLRLLEGLNERWVVFLESLSEGELDRSYLTAAGNRRTIAEMLHHFAHHRRHDVAQITSLRQHNGWSS